jgi:hypothetical protein
MSSSVFLLLSLVSCDCSTPPGPKQENPKDGPTAKWKAEFKLTLEEKNKEWVFSIQGSTNVPKEVVLKARVYAVELVNDPVQGQREDEEPLIWEDEDIQPAFRRIEHDSGSYREDIYRFKKRPWSILYRARVQYRPRDQDEEVVKKYGEDEWSMGADLRLGTEAEFAEQLKAGLKEATEDLLHLERLYNDLRHHVEAQQAKLDLPEWRRWTAEFTQTIEGIDARNKLRYNLWAVWMERQARMRVDGMVELFRRLIKGYAEQFGADKPDYTHLQETLEGWHNYFEEAIEVIGIDAPLDIERVGPIVHDYETAFAPLRGWIEKTQGPDIRREARRDCLSALFKIPPLLQNRKRAYRYVNELTARFTGLLEATEAPPTAERSAQVTKALEEHDRALRDFKVFAGIK